MPSEPAEKRNSVLQNSEDQTLDMRTPDRSARQTKHSWRSKRSNNGAIAEEKSSSPALFRKGIKLTRKKTKTEAEHPNEPE